MKIIKNNLVSILKLNIVAFLFLSLISCTANAQENKQKPNVIFIFADDLGWGDLSAYGGNRIKTPNLDRLASQGTLFTQFYVPASVCSPSRSGIMTGQYPSRNRVFGHFALKMNKQREMPDALNTDLMTLTDIMKKEGYKTAHFGKWHMGNISPSEYGVDTYATDTHSNLPGEKKILGWDAENRPNCTQEVLNTTLSYIKEKKEKGEPFYVNAWLFDVHGVLSPSEKQLNAVKKFAPAHNSEVRNKSKLKFYGVEQVYLAALKNMDNAIGAFIKQLDALGISENTLIIFSSDNGPEDYQIRDAAHSGVGSAGPFRGRKRSIYEGGIRVPFILRWPGKVPADKVNNKSVVNGVDFIPTISSIIGADLPKEIQKQDGENMADVWLGKDRKREEPLFWEWRYNVFGHTLNRSPMIAMRDGDLKVLVNPDGSRLEVYNIVKDPSELYNLAITEPKLANRLKDKALLWYKDIPQSPWRNKAGKNDWNWPK